MRIVLTEDQWIDLSGVPHTTQLTNQNFHFGIAGPEIRELAALPSRRDRINLSQGRRLTKTAANGTLW